VGILFVNTDSLRVRNATELQMADERTRWVTDALDEVDFPTDSSIFATSRQSAGNWVLN
jgi:hypothetical protein